MVDSSIPEIVSTMLLEFYLNRTNGTIVVKETGEQVGFHVIDKVSLENHLFENIKFDTPSTTRHRFGSLILENDGEIYFKLNMQLIF